MNLNCSRVWLLIPGLEMGGRGALQAAARQRTPQWWISVRHRWGQRQQEEANPGYLEENLTPEKK